MPITWRNVDAPSFGESNRLMQSGLNAITGGLQNTSDTITENWDRVKQQNTDRYAAEIMAAQDMDAVANLRASLTPDQLNGRYEGQIDTVGLMGALQDQGRFIRQDAKETIQHENLLMDQSSRDIRGQIQAAYASGDLALGDRLKQEALAAGEIHGDHFSDLLSVRTNRDDELERRRVARANLAISQQAANERSELFRRNTEVHNRSEEDRLRSVATDNLMDQVFNEHIDDPMGTGRQEFAEQLNNIEGMTPTQRNEALTNYDSVVMGAKNIVDPDLIKDTKERIEYSGYNMSVSNPDNYSNPEDYEFVLRSVEILGIENPSQLSAEELRTQAASQREKLEKELNSYPENLYGEEATGTTAGQIVQDFKNGAELHANEAIRMFWRNVPEGVRLDPTSAIQIEQAISNATGGVVGGLEELPGDLAAEITALLGDGTKKGPWFDSILNGQRNRFITFEPEKITQVTNMVMGRYLRNRANVNDLTQKINVLGRGEEAVTGAITKEHERIMTDAQTHQFRMNQGR